MDRIDVGELTLPRRQRLISRIAAALYYPVFIDVELGVPRKPTPWPSSIAVS